MPTKRPEAAAAPPAEPSRNQARLLAELRANPAAPYRLKAQAVETALVSGEHPDLLQRYFGRDGYEELRELARLAETRAARGGPRVLLLPGIMGSTLGRPGNWLTQDTLWIDPVDIARGQLKKLALPEAHGCRALGVVLVAYLKLKLRLRLAGFDAEFYPYDWRQSLDRLGAELAAALAREPAREVFLVAHSMGGLVARAALAQGAPKVKRLVMLGTPNYGSFVPVQALRGSYPVVRKVALLDLRHSPEELAGQIFNTFPGLYQMLPAPDKFSGVDLFRAENWPAAGTPQPAAPRPDLLAQARRAQSLLAPPDARFALIAGVNQDTVTDLQREGDQFVYLVSKDGDGTVPLALAQLPEVKTWFIEETHGGLPNNSTVATAVKDLLHTGDTRALPDHWTPARAAARRLTDADVRQSVPDRATQPRGASVSDSEVRRLIEELAAPASREAPGPSPEQPAPRPQLDRLVVGRRHQRRLELCLARGSLTEAHSRAYVLGMFSDVTPTGAARAVDAQLGGAIAAFVQRRMFAANVGEVFVLPTGSHPVRPDVVLFAGLGPFDRFNEEVLELVADNVIRTFVATGVDDLATVLMGGGSGVAPAAALRALLRGFLRGLLDADSRHQFRRVTLCETDPDQYRALKEELYRLAGTELFAEVEVTFLEETLPAPSEVEAPARGLAPPVQAPVYLMVRQERAPGQPAEFRASVLTAGGKATVLLGRQPVPHAKLEELFQQLARPDQLAPKDLDRLGRQLAAAVLSRELATALAGLRQHHLVIVHDAAASRIPWETLRLDDWAPALQAGLSRRYMAENLSVAKWLEERRQSPTLNVLLVINPTGDLKEAEKEGRRIQDLFGAHPSVRLDLRAGPQATRATLLKDFSSGQYDVIHYAGHAFFDPAHPSRSGLLCHGRQVLSGADLAGLSRLPSLVFFNACEAARLRKPADERARLRRARKRADSNIGLAEAFLRGGTANYVGTYWPVGDEAAKVFAETFYSALLQGRPLGDALLAGRQQVQAGGSVDWADYILYGSPEFVLKTKAG